jgi:rhomboid protease GluP
MMEDRLSISLTNIGYRRIDSNAQGIYLFYRVEENELNIISVIHAINGNEITSEQYAHVLDQIKANFRQSYSHRLHLLSLIFTNNPDNAKHLCAEADQDSHWIVDMSNNRLMIYETQSRDFTGLQNLIESLLDGKPYRDIDSEDLYGNKTDFPGQEHRPNGYDGGFPGQGQNRRPPNRVQFTVVNTSIIIINILVFLITTYLPIFGGKEAMLEKGALSWYFVKENGEIYRILTSMFMHSGWDHLINNMIVLLFVGSNLERAAGKLKYLFIYFGSGIIAGICSISYNMWKEYAQVYYADTTISIGASGAIFGVVGAILYVVVINRGKLPQISTSQMILFVVLSLYSGIINAHIDQAAHIGGFFAGLLLAVILYRRPGRIKEAG